MARITQIPHISIKTDIDREIEKLTTNIQPAIKNCSTTQTPANLLQPPQMKYYWKLELKGTYGKNGKSDAILK